MLWFLVNADADARLPDGNARGEELQAKNTLAGPRFAAEQDAAVGREAAFENVIKPADARTGTVVRSIPVHRLTTVYLCVHISLESLPADLGTLRSRHYLNWR